MKHLFLLQFTQTVCPSRVLAEHCQKQSSKTNCASLKDRNVFDPRIHSCIYLYGQ